MTCTRMEHDLFEYLYTEGPARRRRRVERHLSACAECRARLAELQRLQQALSVPRETPALDDDRIWGNITAALERQAPVQPRQRALFLPRWATVAAAVAVVFVLGIVAGRVWFGRPAPAPNPAPAPLLADNNPPPAAAETGYSIQPVLQRHLDNLQPLLTDIAHGGGGEPLAVPPELVRRLLLDNRLLRQRLERRPDPVASQLLDDIELILLAMRGGKAPDGDTRRSVQDLMQRQGIPLKMKVLQQSSSAVRM